MVHSSYSILNIGSIFIIIGFLIIWTIWLYLRYLSKSSGIR